MVWSTRRTRPCDRRGSATRRLRCCGTGQARQVGAWLASSSAHCGPLRLKCAPSVGFLLSLSFVCVFPSNHVRAPSHERRRGYGIALGSSAFRTSGPELGDFRLDLCGAWPSLEGDPEVQVSVPFPFAHEDLAGGRYRSTALLKDFGASLSGHKGSARDGGLAGLEAKKVGYTPVGFMRCRRAVCFISTLKSSLSKEFPSVSV